MEKDTKEVQVPDFSGEEMKMPENSFVRASEPAESYNIINSPILLILTILLVLILGGMYFWFQSITPENTVPTPVSAERPTPEENNEPESTTAEAQVETLQTLSTSDEIGAIESDIEATELDNLDAELEAIDAELEAALESN